MNRLMRPTVGITMGDPAGIGPEIVVRALGDRQLRSTGKLVLIGDPDVFSAAAKLVGNTLPLRTAAMPLQAELDDDSLNIIAAGILPAGELKPGTLDSRWGKAAADCCRRAVDLATAGHLDAIVSSPFNKEAFHLAGFDAMDDMTYFQDCFKNQDEVFMVGEVGGIWVTTVTFHVSFKEIIKLITVTSVLDKIRSLGRVLEAVGPGPHRIGVAGLNVHAGEGGIFGHEEIDTIEPAIEQARAEGFDVVGPVPPDSIFPGALKGNYNGVVCMYHDQANIGRKIIGMNDPGVTLYMGMPTPVVTVPHGTAYDIAWQGVASHDMIRRAIETALSLAGSAMDGSSGTGPLSRPDHSDGETSGAPPRAAVADTDTDPLVQAGCPRTT